MKKLLHLQETFLKYIPEKIKIKKRIRQKDIFLNAFIIEEMKN